MHKKKLPEARKRITKKGVGRAFLGACTGPDIGIILKTYSFSNSNKLALHETFLDLTKLKSLERISLVLINLNCSLEGRGGNIKEPNTIFDKIQQNTAINTLKPTKSTIQFRMIIR